MGVIGIHRDEGSQDQCVIVVEGGGYVDVECNNVALAVAKGHALIAIVHALIVQDHVPRFDDNDDRRTCSPAPPAAAGQLSGGGPIHATARSALGQTQQSNRAWGKDREENDRGDAMRQYHHMS